MTIHKEGKETLTYSFILLCLINLVLFYINQGIFLLFLVISVLLYAFLISFFRKPIREFKGKENFQILAPADGKVVVIEEVFEEEFIQSKCKMVSVFMSPLNVHINWYPCNATVKYSKYHPGKYLVAWHPKSSTENERTTVVLETSRGDVLLRQVAGALARRIVCYSKEEERVKGGEEMGFIKFGSRVDIYLPLDAKIEVGLNQKVTGKETLIATL
jgi:phosphatidylserine decarboxylase